MKKTKVQTKKGNSITLHPEVKTHTAPEIKNSYVDDETGEVMHTLENGNIISDTNYLKMWGTPKGAILPKNTKANSPDGRTNWIK